MMRWAWRLGGSGLVVLLLAALNRTQPAVMTTSSSDNRRTNRLIHEASPYLLQHAYNPVDWYPWGEEAFAKAKQEDKPVFLSVGYSTCYWCHVMEQESFEHPDIAKLLNEHFVSIKVDREERPDIDALYMTAVQAMSGQGGWPMSVFLTPEGRPFWGGTYFPPEDRWGRPGFPAILRSIAEAWRTKRDEILSSSEAITQALQADRRTASPAALGLQTLQTVVEQLANQFDPVHGGFGEAPKFPRSHALSLLLRLWSRSQDAQPLQMVETTLQAMAHGGIHDQLGGGFHRYSTDAQWLVPHFEKMLYDQALLARTYLEAYQITGKAEYAAVARGIFDYVLRDLRDPAGAFYSAEDAGEVGKEGEFYVWTLEDLERAVGAEDATFISQFYGVTAQGNFEGGGSILHVPMALDRFAQEQGLAVSEIRARLEGARAKLLVARSQRPRPHRDDKILTDWNGLMIGTLAYGARVLDEPRYAQAAAQAADFVLTTLQRDGRLLHRYRDGHADIAAFLDDYAFFLWGLLELYEATFESRWLAEAVRLTHEMIRLFWDGEQGGFWLSGAHNERLIAPTKELYDGALPSGNSVAAHDLVRLGLLTMDASLQRYAQELFQAFAASLAQAPHAFTQCVIALDLWLGPSQEIVIAGDPSAEDTARMMRVIAERFLPRAVTVLHPSGPHAAALESLVPFVAAQQPLDGRATAYVCQNYQCRLPTTEPDRLASLLDELRGRTP